MQGRGVEVPSESRALPARTWVNLAAVSLIGSKGSESFRGMAPPPSKRSAYVVTASPHDNRVAHGDVHGYFVGLSSDVNHARSEELFPVFDLDGGRRQLRSRTPLHEVEQVHFLFPSDGLGSVRGCEDAQALRRFRPSGIGGGHGRGRGARRRSRGGIAVRREGGAGLSHDPGDGRNVGVLGIFCRIEQALR